MFQICWVVGISLLEKAQAGKRLIVHIGAPKCGSSAIQIHLALNEKTLADQGVLVPSVNLDIGGVVEGHQVWFIEDLKSRTDAVEWLSSRLSGLAAHMDANGMHTAILSAENIIGYPWLANIFQEASVGFDIQIIIYVRRQDEFIISSWQQWGLKEFGSLREYTRKDNPILEKWGAILAPWELTIGSSRIMLRPFRRDMLVDGDVVTDFFNALDLSQDGMIPVPGPTNPSYDEHLGDLAHRIRDVFAGPHDFRFFQVMESLLGEKSFKSRGASHLMSLAERREFLARYDADNNALRDRYLPEFGNRPLFDPPGAETVALLSDTEKLRAENGVLIRSVYLLAQGIESLEAKLNDMSTLVQRVEALESEAAARVSLAEERQAQEANAALALPWDKSDEPHSEEDSASEAHSDELSITSDDLSEVEKEQAEVN